MSRAFRILVNPVSGGGGAPRAVEAVAEVLRAAGAGVTVVRSESVAHSRAEVDRAVAAGEVVVAAGGDGMLASLGGAVVAAGGDLGIVPAGRGNDFARMLGLPEDSAASARVLLEGAPRPVDVLEVEGPGVPTRVVLGSLYAGVDSVASEIVDASRWMPAALQYPTAAVRALLTYRPARFTVEVDGVPLTRGAYTVVAANSAYYGKGMKIAPTAAVTDGILDVVVIPDGSRWSMVRRLPRVYDGTHVDLDEVTVLRGAEVRLSADREVIGYGDGERIGPLPVTVRVLPGALRVLLP